MFRLLYSSLIGGSGMTMAETLLASPWSSDAVGKSSGLICPSSIADAAECHVSEM